MKRESMRISFEEIDDMERQISDKNARARRAEAVSAELLAALVKILSNVLDVTSLQHIDDRNYVADCCRAAIAKAKGEKL